MNRKGGTGITSTPTEKIKPGDMIRIQPLLALNPKEELALVLDIWTVEPTLDNFYRGSDYFRVLIAGEKRDIRRSYYYVVKHEEG